MGDDLLDMPVLRRVGLSAAPADAAREVREQVDWVSPSGGGRGAVRDLIELVLRAQGRWESVVPSTGARDGRLHSPVRARLSRCSPAWRSARPGSATSCEDGRWIDRRRARESPHYMLGLNFLVANQIEPAIEELTPRRRDCRGTARDSTDPRQPVSREGTGRTRDPGASAAAAASGLCANSNTRTCCCVSASTTSAAVSSTARSKRSPRCCASIPRISTRSSNLEKLYEEQHQWREAYSTRQKLAGAGRRHVTGAPPGDPGVPRKRDRPGCRQAQATMPRPAALPGRGRSGFADRSRVSQPWRCRAPAGGHRRRDCRVGAADRTRARTRISGVLTSGNAYQESVRRAVSRRCAGA